MPEPVQFDILIEMGVLVMTTDLPAPAAEVGESHSFSDHTPCWAYEAPMRQHPYDDPEKSVFEVFPPDVDMQTVAEHAGVVVFIGAADTSQFRYFLGRPDTAIVIFEPDRERLAKFVQSFKPKDLAAGGVFIYQGDLRAVPFHLAKLFPLTLFKKGFPVFYRLENIHNAWPEYVEDIIEYIEFLFYRHRMYQIAGQFNTRSMPLRPMFRDLFYDQFKHTYDNIVQYVTQPSLQLLRNKFSDCTAILVAAGKDVNNQIEFIRKNKDRTVVIAVNNALRILIQNDIKPHFVVINDSSEATIPGFDGLPRLDDVVLAAHSLSFMSEKLPRKFLFGAYQPDVFGPRPMLRLHGSVITTAFSLARFLGCSRAIMAGVQLSSSHPYNIGYAKGSIHAREESDFRELIHRFPQLYPVRNPFGREMYTNLNFRDAALWFLEEIRLSEMDVINLTQDSIVYGPGVRFDENPKLPEDPRVNKLFDEVLNCRELPDVDLREVFQFIDNEMEKWRNTIGPINTIMDMGGNEFLQVGAHALAQLDQANVSYMVQQFEDFNNKHFHYGYFEGKSEAEKEEALRYYFDYVRRMSELFLSILKEQRAELIRLTGN